MPAYEVELEYYTPHETTVTVNNADNVEQAEEMARLDVIANNDNIRNLEVVTIRELNG